MKKFLLAWLVVWLISSAVSIAAYTPSEKDTQSLTSLKTQLDSLIDNNIDLWNFYNQIVNLQNDYSGNERLNYMFEDLKYHLYSDKKNKNALSKQKSDAKVKSKDSKTEFLEEYNTWFSVEIEDSLKNCTGRYKTLDDISFAYDFPTALTIAVWYRESTCAYYLPNNWDGPFQILSKDYGTGEITQKQFVQIVMDFMEFAKNKLARYDGQLSGELSYNSFDMTWVLNFIALYNGWSRSWNVIIPNNYNYAYDWYGEEYSWAKKYGIVPQMLKVLEWELENEY